MNHALERNAYDKNTLRLSVCSDPCGTLNQVSETYQACLAKVLLALRLGLYIKTLQPTTQNIGCRGTVSALAVLDMRGLLYT